MKKKCGNTLIENVISIGILCVYIAVIAGITGNLMYQEKILNEFTTASSLAVNTAEEILNKRYAQILVGTQEETVDDFTRTVTVTQNLNIKEINIQIQSSNAEMQLSIEKGLDIN